MHGVIQWLYNLSLVLSPIPPWTWTKWSSLNYLPNCPHSHWYIQRIFQPWSEICVSLFVCNRGDTYYSIMVGSRQGSLAKPLSLLFLTPRPVLSSHQHRTLVCLFWSGNLHCAHSPANPTTARQECFELLDVSNSPNYSFSNNLPSLGSPRVTILLASSVRMLVHCETQ